MILLPQGLNALKQVATQVEADLRSASLNLDGGCDAASHRTGMCPAGLIPHITESARKRKAAKRGCKRRCHPCVADAGRTDLGVGGHLPAVVAPC
jgi:hypothetical protein